MLVQKSKINGMDCMSSEKADFFSDANTSITNVLNKDETW